MDAPALGPEGSPCLQGTPPELLALWCTPVRAPSRGHGARWPLTRLWGWAGSGGPATLLGVCHLRHTSPQVISGGHYDVDCYVEDPNGKTIYQETKKQYDSFSHHTDLKGVYTFCFSNEFSTFSHKIVYFDFQVGDEPPILPDMNNRVTALTQVGARREEGREGGSCPAPKQPCGLAVGDLSPSSLAGCRSANRQQPRHTPHPVPGLWAPPSATAHGRELHQPFHPRCEPLGWASRCPGGLPALSQWGTTLDGFWQRRHCSDCPGTALDSRSCATAKVTGRSRPCPQLESACVTIHEMLNAVIDSQTHYRLREAQDRSRAEELNGRVSYWSVGETLILFVVSIGQVMLLKSFFTEKRPSSGGAGT
ncbi:hypothetical protein Nmel_013768 [Mimus melanotis]